MAIRADDTFTEAVDTNLEDHVPSPTGTAWQTQVAASFIVAAAVDNVSNNSGADEVAKETTDITTPNMIVRADCESGDPKVVAGIGPMTRLPSGDVSVAANRDGFAAVFEGAADKTGADVVLYRVDNGSPTELGRFNGNFGGGVVVNVRIESDSADDHRVFVDNVLRIGPINDTAHNTNQFAGLFTRAATNDFTLDNFRSEDIAVPVLELFMTKLMVHP